MWLRNWCHLLSLVRQIVTWAFLLENICSSLQLLLVMWTSPSFLCWSSVDALASSENCKKDGRYVKTKKKKKKRKFQQCGEIHHTPPVVSPTTTTPESRNTLIKDENALGGLDNKGEIISQYQYFCSISMNENQSHPKKLILSSLKSWLFSWWYTR